MNEKIRWDINYALRKIEKKKNLFNLTLAFAICILYDSVCLCECLRYVCVCVAREDERGYLWRVPLDGMLCALRYFWLYDIFVSTVRGTRMCALSRTHILHFLFVKEFFKQTTTLLHGWIEAAYTIYAFRDDRWYSVTFEVVKNYANMVVGCDLRCPSGHILLSITLERGERRKCENATRKYCLKLSSCLEIRNTSSINWWFDDPTRKTNFRSPAGRYDVAAVLFLIQRSDPIYKNGHTYTHINGSVIRNQRSEPFSVKASSRQKSGD